MQAVARRSRPLASTLTARRIGGRRYPPPTHHRTFHPSQSTPLALFPWGGQPNKPDNTDDPIIPEISIAKSTSQSEEVAFEKQPAGPGTKEKSANHGSAAKRWMRNRRQKDIPPIVIPGWFLDKNVSLFPDSVGLIGGTLNFVRDDETRLKAKEEKDGRPFKRADQPQASDTTAKSNDEEKLARSIPSYRLDADVMHEVRASISAGLSLSRVEATDSFATGKSHVKLHCPVNGGIYLLEMIVQSAASTLRTDIIRLEAQDLAEIAGDYIKEGADATSNALWTLGYDVHQVVPRSESSESAEQEKEDEEEEEDADENLPAGRSRMPQFASLTAIPLMNTPNGLPDIRGLFKNIQDRIAKPSNGRGSQFPGNITGLVSAREPSNTAGQWNDLKLNALLESLLEANLAKRSGPDIVKDADAPETPSGTSNSQSEVEDASTSEAGNRSDHSPNEEVPGSRTIILIRDFKEISLTPQGQNILEKLVNIVQKRRKEGQQIVIVGTTASEDLTPELSKSAFDSLQAEDADSVYRTLVILPAEAGPNGGRYYRDERIRNREINTRFIHDMIQRLLPQKDAQPLDEFVHEIVSAAKSFSLLDVLCDAPLSFDEVHRIVITAIGAHTAESTQQVKTLRSRQIIQAMVMLDKSDQSKDRWAKSDKVLRNPSEKKSKQDLAKSMWKHRMTLLKAKCNKHERALLHGVVDPADIRTTFNDVHVSPETIETLKNLTTLSLSRPEAFKYGVLATDKITGLLLYGPPGTGKTLLARAVAKESGAKVLQVSGSDIYDKYVGESEKNVRAIFSLAAKLSPCVVFIDEADAIFASRGSGTNRNSHRDLINQFLKEWDGMIDTNAFIMVATNRPFDLDDAALRRLPRRLLVDLPVEKDREAILRIHLKSEAINADVSIAKLALDTPFYSGSDLKNLVVAAAITAVREENDAAAMHKASSSEPYVYPERRTLTQKHFARAMEEITASVSEDMSSLRAIRKFDERYGDRRGRKKKSVYGFAGIETVKEDAVQVRS